jgi:lipopolysaccharide biosynthesis glycosyltransferase
MIHVASTCNNSYIQGLAVTLLSIIESNNNNNSFSFHIFDSGISDKNRETIKNLVEKHSPNSIVNYYIVDQSVFTGLVKDYGRGYSTYARLLIGRHIKADRLVYIDSDFLVMKDISEIWNLEMHDKIVYATRDLDTPDGQPAMLTHDCPFAEASSVKNYFYYTCGFLLVDLLAWHREDIESQCLQAVKGYETRLKAWDQTILNYVLRGRIGTLDQNCSLSCDWRAYPSDCNIHYISKRKPWNSWYPFPAYSLWRVFYKIYISKELPLEISLFIYIKGFLMYLRDRLAISSSLFLNIYKRFLSCRHSTVSISLYEKSLSKLKFYVLDNGLKKNASDLNKLYSRRLYSPKPRNTLSL